jgi:hypothetical protein
VGLATDVALIVAAGRQLQVAADAASLAAAALVRINLANARQAAIRLAHDNKAAGSPVQLLENAENLADGDIVVGRYNRDARVFTPTLTGCNAVKVVARRIAGSPGGPVSLLFGPVFGVDTINLERSAIAMVGGGTGAGLITLNETEKWTFRLGGNVILDVNDVNDPLSEGAAIQVNSANPDALKFDGIAATLEAGVINVHATEADMPPPEVFDGPVETSQPIIPDPLEGLVEPGEGINRGPCSITGGSQTLLPGYYPEGISITGGTVELQPGIYVLGGCGLSITGGDVTGEGVMFYLEEGDKCAVKLTGNGIFDVKPIPWDPELPDEQQDDYAGILIWQSALNDNPAKIIGTDQFTGLEGTLYFPKARVDIAGTSDSFGIRQLICDSVEISGTGRVIINYDGRRPAPGRKPFLVE